MTQVASLHANENQFNGYVSEAFRATCRTYGFDIGKCVQNLPEHKEPFVEGNTPKGFLSHLRAELLADLVEFAILPESYKWDEHGTGMVFCPSGRNSIEHIGHAKDLTNFREVVFRHIIRESII